MAPLVQSYFRQGLAPSTQRTYDAALRQFHAFCMRYHADTPFPVSEYLLCCFAAHLANEGLAPQTATCYLMAVCNMQLSLGLPDPRDHSSFPTLKRVLAGIRRARLSHSATPRVRLPITGTIMTRLHHTLLALPRSDRQLIWAVASLAFFRFFRLGELLVEAPDWYDPAVHLSWGDVVVDNRTYPSMVKVHLKRSKCDQFGRGVDVIVGQTDTPICPVAAVVTSRALLHHSAGVSSHKIMAIVQQVGAVRSSLGLQQDEYAGHSFRIGAATSAVLAGVEDSTIQTLGRWQRAAFLQFIRMPREQLPTISRRLALAAMVSPAPLGGHTQSS